MTVRAAFTPFDRAIPRCRVAVIPPSDGALSAHVAVIPRLDGETPDTPRSYLESDGRSLSVYRRCIVALPLRLRAGSYSSARNMNWPVVSSETGNSNVRGHRLRKDYPTRVRCGESAL